MKDRKQTPALDYANEVATKNQLSESERQDVITIASATKRPNETSPTVISAIGSYMCGSTVEYSLKLFANEV